jgi:hypothetical protein
MIAYITTITSYYFLTFHIDTLSILIILLRGRFSLLSLILSRRHWRFLRYTPEIGPRQSCFSRADFHTIFTAFSPPDKVTTEDCHSWVSQRFHDDCHEYIGQSASLHLLVTFQPAITEATWVSQSDRFLTAISAVNILSLQLTRGLQPIAFRLISRQSDTTILQLQPNIFSTLRLRAILFH